MNQFVFLYRGGQRPSPSELGEQVLQKWAVWLKELSDKGHLIDRGQALDWQGKLVRGSEKTVTDGPFTEIKEIIGGFTLIRAKDLTQAAELAKGCPILERGGQVEVRPVMKLET
jgi:hypothetical protein